MNWDFLQQEYGGNPLSVYLKFLLLITIVLLLKKNIAGILARVFYTVFRKFASGYHGIQFRNLLSHPIQGIILSIAFYIAFVPLDNTLSRVIIWSRVFPAESPQGETTHYIVSLMDVIDQLFLLSMFFFITLLLSRLLSFFFLVWIKNAEHQKDRARQQMLPLLKDILHVTIWVISFFVILGAVFKVNVAALIAGLGIGGIAIAFAAKERLENLLASFMVMLDKPFTIGDWIKVDNVEGTIEKVGFRSSRIRSFDKSVIVLPNRKLIDSNLENFSERGLRRVQFTIGAVYGISRENLRQIMEEVGAVIRKTPDTINDPLIYLDSFGDSSVNIQVTYYVVVSPDVNFLALKQEINLAVYEIMYRLGTGFAFPTQVTIKGDAINDVTERDDGRAGHA